MNSEKPVPGKLFVDISASSALRHSPRWTSSFHSGILLPSGQPVES
eukprot:COSAG05_NODE_886_length_6751_cov_151.638906_16_plen_46_part_00